MKKHMFILLTCVLTFIIFTGCAEQENAAAANEAEFTVITTIFPTYDWVRQILGERAGNFNLSFLTDTGIDLHSFQPSVSDMARIMNADVFIYVGGHSDGWVENVLREANNPNQVFINLMHVLGDAVYTQAHGCTHPECDHDHGHHHHGHHHGHHHHDCDDPDCEHDYDHHHHHHYHHECSHDHHYDEHVWLSLPFAKTITAAIAEALIALDPANETIYRANVNAYIGELWLLHAEFQSMVNAAPRNTLLFADRFPFHHLLHDYNLRHYAAFPGCTAESEASFSVMANLISRVNDLQLTTLLVTETSDKNIARTIARDADGDPQVLVLHSLQSVTARDVQAGKTFLSVKRNNLEVLREALQ